MAKRQSKALPKLEAKPYCIKCGEVATHRTIYQPKLFCQKHFMEWCNFKMDQKKFRI